MGNEFAKLDEIVDLQEAGRTNAARAEWRALDEPFRVRVLKFVMFVLEHPHFYATTPQVVLVTLFGEWRMNQEKLRRLVAAVQELIRVDS